MRKFVFLVFPVIESSWEHYAGHGAGLINYAALGIELRQSRELVRSLDTAVVYRYQPAVPIPRHQVAPAHNHLCPSFWHWTRERPAPEPSFLTTPAQSGPWRSGNSSSSSRNRDG